MPAPLPTIEQHRHQGDTHWCKLSADASLPQFTGHFPGRPLLPGIAQVDWAVQLAKLWNDETADIDYLSRIKFIRPIQPGAVLELSIQRMGDGVYRYRFLAGEQDYSSGTLHFSRRG